MCRDREGMVWRSGRFVPVSVPVSYAPDFGPEGARDDRGDAGALGRPGRRTTDPGDSGEEELDVDELVGLTEEMAIDFGEEEDLSWVDD